MKSKHQPAHNVILEAISDSEALLNRERRFNQTEGARWRDSERGHFLGGKVNQKSHASEGG